MSTVESSNIQGKACEKIAAALKVNIKITLLVRPFLCFDRNLINIFMMISVHRDHTISVMQRVWDMSML